MQFLTDVHFISPSLSDFSQSGVLKYLRILKKAEKTQELLKRKVRILLMKSHLKQYVLKQEDGDLLCSDLETPVMLTWRK